MEHLTCISHKRSDINVWHGCDIMWHTGNRKHCTHSYHTVCGMVSHISSCLLYIIASTFWPWAWKPFGNWFRNTMLVLATSLGPVHNHGPIPLTSNSIAETLWLRYTKQFCSQSAFCCGLASSVKQPHKSLVNESHKCTKHYNTNTTQ